MSTFDVIVVGGGAAGLPLALCASERAARVLLIESAPVLGGTLDRSWASTAAAGTRQQADNAIKDDPEAHYADIMRISRHEADPQLTRLWVENAARTIAWLEELGTRFRFSPKVARGPGAHEPYNVARVQLVEGRGVALIRVFEPKIQDAARRDRIVLRMQSRVVGLQSSASGAITGVIAEDPDGSTHEFAGRSVVLTSGGCTGNARLYADLHATPLYYDGGYPFCRGDGILLGQGAGSVVRGGDRYCPLLGLVMSDDTIPGYPSGGDFLESTIDSSVEHRLPWEIWVNAEGHRFVREDAPNPQDKEQALGRQTGHRLWMLHDHAMMQSYGSPITGWSRTKYEAAFDSNPMCLRADSLGALALEAGLDAHEVWATVSEYNDGLRRGAPDRFGREHRPAPITAAPFYAVRLQGYTLQTFAGLAANDRLQVLRADGRPIENLYAAGEILGGTAVGASGYSTGSMITPAITFGRMLGQSLLPL